MSELPSSWKTLPISDLGKWVTGSTPPSKDKENYGNEVLFVTPGDIGDGRRLGAVARRISKKGAQKVRLVNPPSIQLVCIGTIGKVAWTDQVITTNQQINSLEVNSSVVLPAFAMWLMASPQMQEKLWAASSSTTVAILNKGNLERISVSIPPIAEQHQIVEILEDHLSRLDTALADVKQSRIKATQFRSSLLHSAFTGKLSALKERSEWVTIPLGEVAAVKGGKRLPKGTKWSESKTSHPYIRATDVKRGQIDFDNLVYVPDEIWPKISRYIVNENDVVITIAGTIGETAVVSNVLDRANLTENAAKLTLDTQILNPHFCSYFLKSPACQQIITELSKATTQAKLALYRIQTIDIPLPPLSEQDRIVEILEDHLSRIDAYMKVVNEIELSAKAFRRSLLQAAFTGQLTREATHV